MTITIGLGWWLAPLSVTIAAFALAWYLTDRPSRASGHCRDLVGALFAVLLFGSAVIVALLAWLIWAVLT